MKIQLENKKKEMCLHLIFVSKNISMFIKDMPNKMYHTVEF